MARILLVGTATLDMVFRLDHYPGPDEEMRAQSLRTGRGGNAANTAVVLAGLGQSVEFLGVLADAPETAVIERDFMAHGVEFKQCPRLQGKPPTSSIYLCQGLRSIVHYRDLPELDATAFMQLDLGSYDWLHLEGRNVPQLTTMLAHVRERFPRTRVSLELEKPREGIGTLFAQADLLLCAQGFSRHYGYDDPRNFLQWMQSLAPRATLAVAWGMEGACGMTADGVLCHAPSLRVEQVVDTLGAGDTFNAGMIDACIKGMPLQEALEYGCNLAGRKCSIEGFDLWR
jgi:ketohexokinase